MQFSRFSIMVIFMLNFFNVNSHALQQHQFEITIEPLWQELDTNVQSIERFGGKWIAISKITFKNRAKEVIKVKNLTLHWHGKQLNHLFATLYRADEANQNALLPLEQYALSDSVWATGKQQLLFSFKKPQLITSSTTFYLVLTIPQSTQQLLSQGYFTIDAARLPYQAQHYVHNNQLKLKLLH